MRPCFNSAENGYKSKTIRTALRGRALLLAVTAAVAIGLTGCSWTFPGFRGESVSQKVMEDDITTGSIKPLADPQAPVGQLKNLTDEDWRRAKAALAVAVDPHGTSDRVLWDNPQTLAKGSFAPDGAPFVRNDEVCRNFKTVVTDQLATQDLLGTACRPSGGNWKITEIAPLPKSKAVESKVKAAENKPKSAGKPGRDADDLAAARKLLALPAAAAPTAKEVAKSGK